MSTKAVARREVIQEAPALLADRPVEEARGLAFEAQAIVQMVGMAISQEDDLESNTRTRLSLALSGAEALLNHLVANLDDMEPVSKVQP